MPARFMPYLTVDHWLEPERADALLAYAIANQHRYVPGSVLHYGRHTVDAELRSGTTLRTLGPFGDALRDRALALRPELERAFGTPAFAADGVEIELAAHGDGAHFHRHVDTFVAINHDAAPRVFTLVLYLHRRPVRFSGGELRMHALGSDAAVDVAPAHNRLLAFPSITPHSVRRVSCPGGAFADQRFAINMWIRRADRTEAAVSRTTAGKG
jgi:SM-20-related protein